MTVNFLDSLHEFNAHEIEHFEFAIDRKQLSCLFIIQFSVQIIDLVI